MTDAHRATDPWAGHAPDLVRDNRRMHERIAEQDREIERLKAEIAQIHKEHREDIREMRNEAQDMVAEERWRGAQGEDYGSY